MVTSVLTQGADPTGIGISVLIGTLVWFIGWTLRCVVSGRLSFVLRGLVKRRAQLAGEIENTHEAVRKMVLDLESLDATGRNRPLVISKQATLTQKLMAAADRQPTSESCRFTPHPALL
jgi:hypothetical protein